MTALVTYIALGFVAALMLVFTALIVAVTVSIVKDILRD